MIGSSSFSPSPSSEPPKEAPEPPPRLDILEQILKDDRHQLLTQNNTAALKHFVTSFVWVDILSRASGLHPSPSNSNPPAPTTQPFDYLPLLEDSTLDLSRVMGCENWVFIGLARIITLASCMRAPRDQGHHPSATDQDSSLLDLHSQATVLEAMLERGLRGLREARARGGLETELEMHSSLVTELFALAAITYLHVTASGAWPFLPAVRASAARTVAALCALPEELLIRVSWPFAVAGCMVLEEGRGVVRGVVAKAQSRGFNIGTVWKGMLVVEECWRLRDAAGEMAVEVSWVDAMGSLGERILLC
jgi:C6 transcription factor Pro1